MIDSLIARLGCTRPQFPKRLASTTGASLRSLSASPRSTQQWRLSLKSSFALFLRETLRDTATPLSVFVRHAERHRVAPATNGRGPAVVWMGAAFRRSGRTGSSPPTKANRPPPLVPHCQLGPRLSPAFRDLLRVVAYPHIPRCLCDVLARH